MNKKHPSSPAGGYIIMINTLIFLAIVFVVVTAIVAPLVSSHNATGAYIHTTRAYLAGNSAAEEVLYRLKNSYDLESSEILDLGTATATIAVASGANSKTVTIDSVDTDYSRDLKLEFSTGAGVNFNYGLQAGRGGFLMTGGATINGNVYSNGDIIGSGGPIITGSAIVANRSNPVANQTSSGPTPPPYNIDFGGNTTPQDFAQSFSVSTSTDVTSVRLYVKRTTTGWMNDITMYITADNGGKPQKTKLDSVNISTSQITTAYNYISVPLSSALNLVPGNTYWLVLDTSTTWGNYYSIAGATAIYSNGAAKTGSWSNSNGGSWSNTSPAGLDAYFDVYVGGETGLISGISIGQNGGETWAHQVNDSYLYGDLYCQGSSGNNKPCDTSRPDPAEQPFPVSDGNIDDWKAEAESDDVIDGDVAYGGSDVEVLGSVRINGDLTVTSGANVEITGTVYVTGNISVSGGAVVHLSNSYGHNPGVMVSDGRVSLSGGGVVEGNDTGGYMLLVTTSTCPTGACGGKPAVDVSGGTDSVILNAQKGTIRFTGGATANQATGYLIEMSGGTTVNYVSGLADVNFSSGPSGSWTIDSWSEI